MLVKKDHIYLELFKAHPEKLLKLISALIIRAILLGISHLHLLEVILMHASPLQNGRINFLFFFVRYDNLIFYLKAMTLIYAADLSNVEL